MSRVSFATTPPQLPGPAITPWASNRDDFVSHIGKGNPNGIALTGCVTSHFIKTSELFLPDQSGVKITPFFL